MISNSIRLSAIAPQIVMKPFCSSCFFTRNGRWGNHRQGMSSKKAFCISGMVASDAIESTPTWASCTEYIGRRQPLGASLANLVEVSHNLCNQSGKMIALRRELTRHAHLVLESEWSSGQEHLSSLAPLSSCLLNKG